MSPPDARLAEATRQGAATHQVAAGNPTSGTVDTRRLPDWAPILQYARQSIHAAETQGQEPSSYSAELAEHVEAFQDELYQRWATAASQEIAARYHIHPKFTASYGRTIAFIKMPIAKVVKTAAAWKGKPAIARWAHLRIAEIAAIVRRTIDPTNPRSPDDWQMLDWLIRATSRHPQSSPAGCNRITHDPTAARAWASRIYAHLLPIEVAMARGMPGLQDCVSAGSKS